METINQSSKFLAWNPWTLALLFSLALVPFVFECVKNLGTDYKVENALNKSCIKYRRGGEKTGMPLLKNKNGQKNYTVGDQVRVADLFLSCVFFFKIFIGNFWTTRDQVRDAEPSRTPLEFQSLPRKIIFWPGWPKIRSRPLSHSIFRADRYSDLGFSKKIMEDTLCEHPIL